MVEYAAGAVKAPVDKPKCAGSVVAEVFAFVGVLVEVFAAAGGAAAVAVS